MRGGGARGGSEVTRQEAGLPAGSRARALRLRPPSHHHSQAPGAQHARSPDPANEVPAALRPPQPARRRLYPHTLAARKRQQRNGFGRSSLHLFIFILPLTDEQHNGSGFPGCHKPRNILMKNKCIYRETSKQPKTSQSNVPVPGTSAFISSPLHGLQADHAAERDKYFKQQHFSDARLCKTGNN